VEHPDYALYSPLIVVYEKETNLEVLRILCTNRDENLNRPTQKAHFHSFHQASRMILADPSYQVGISKQVDHGLESIQLAG
jgi:hypothetical protein